MALDNYVSNNLIESLKYTQKRHDITQAVGGLARFIRNGQLNSISRSENRDALEGHRSEIIKSVFENYLLFIDKSSRHIPNTGKIDVRNQPAFASMPLDIFARDLLEDTRGDINKAADFLQQLMFTSGSASELYNIAQTNSILSDKTRYSLRQLADYSVQHSKDASPSMYISTVVADRYTQRELAKDKISNWVINVAGNAQAGTGKSYTPLEYAMLTMRKKYISDSPSITESQLLDRMINLMCSAYENEYINTNYFTRSENARAMLDNELHRQGKTLKEYIEQEVAIENNMARTNSPNVARIEPHARPNDNENLERFRKKVKSRQAEMNGMGGYGPINIIYQRAQSYTLEAGKNMAATTNIGCKRSNQEDAVVLVEHPENPDFKMMIVADGMGGLDNGELASYETAVGLAEWFRRIPTNYYSHIDTASQECAREIVKISDKVARKFEHSDSSGSTVVCAIIGENQTAVQNVGDSRAYCVSKGKLVPLTKDDSLLDHYNDLSRDDIRFHPQNNVINSYVGRRNLAVSDVHTNYISNRDYDALLLFSDGVTDLVAEDRIRKLTLAAITRFSSPTEIAKRISSNLVKEAVENDAVATKQNLRNLTEHENRRGNYDASFRTKISAGKDNTTAAVYISDKDDR